MPFGSGVSDVSTPDTAGWQRTGGADAGTPATVPAGQFANVSGSLSWRPGPRKPSTTVFTIAPPVPRRQWMPMFVAPAPAVGGFVPTSVMFEKIGADRG